MAGASWVLGPLFEQLWLRTTRQYYISNFKISEPSKSGEEDF